MSVNRGKRSVAIDTKSQPGKDILKLLARDADVLVENFRPGVMDRLGVGYDVLKEVNPRLIYCSVSGFGPTGVHAKRPAFDSLLQAAGGLISATGPADPAQSPFPSPIELAPEAVPAEEPSLAAGSIARNAE